MRKLRIISISLAVAFLMMHSVVPHEHHAELSEDENFQQHQLADSSLFGLLQVVFHIDQGSNHLEDFQTSYYDLDFSQFIQSDVQHTFRLIVFDSPKPSFSYFKVHFPDHPEISSLDTRGPPKKA